MILQPTNTSSASAYEYMPQVVNHSYATVAAKQLKSLLSFARAKAREVCVSSIFIAQSGTPFTLHENPQKIVHAKLARTGDVSYDIKMRTVEYYRTLLTFNDLKQLKDGWDSYKASAPNLISIENARRFALHSIMSGVNPAHIGPSGMGGIGITFEKGDREVVVEFYNNGTAHSLFSINSTGEMIAKKVNVQMYVDFLYDISRHINVT